MITAEEYLKQNGMSNVGHYGLLISDPSKSKMHQIMHDYAKLYAKEAIKADRENVAKHVKLNPPTNFWQQRFVDKDSIINAPSIQLL